MITELDALRVVNLDWTRHLESIWTDDPCDIPAVQENTRRELMARLRALEDAPTDTSPLGTLLLGPAGAGKTHLLGVLRAATLRQEGTFVLVDLSTVRDFWKTVLLGFFKSLTTPAAGPAGQHALVLQRVLSTFAPPSTSAVELGTAPPERFLELSNHVLSGMSRTHRDLALEHQDVVRAFLLLGSQHFQLQNIGYSWLLGGDPTVDAGVPHGIRAPAPDPESIVRGLSWLISFRGPCVLAFDQLDAVIAEKHAAATPADASAPGEANQAAALLLSVSGGLMALRDLTRRTLTVVSALRESWTALMDTSVAAVQGRFEDPLFLPALQSGTVARDVVAKRLRAGFERSGFAPPYESWPFRPEAFASVEGAYTRETLRMCDQHLKRCLRNAHVEELFTFDELRSDVPATPEDQDAMSSLDAAFQAAHRDVALDALHDRARDHAQDDALHALAEALAVELFPQGPPPTVQRAFPSRQTFEPLHAALRIPDAAGLERTWILGLRFLQHESPVAFQARIRAAMTESGVELGVEHRHCVVFRTHAAPCGGVTVELLRHFERSGGILVNPSDPELRVFAALATLLRTYGADDPDLRRWLRTRRPASQLTCLTETVAWLESIRAVPPAEDADGLPLGRRTEGEDPGTTFEVPIQELSDHMVVLTGSGSGKTVLLKRLIEEAALRGIPTIVLDSAYDMARLRQPWAPGDGPRDAESRAKAASYFASTDVVVHALGHGSGPPTDPDELFGLGVDRTRISVIHLAGLPSLATRRAFVDQLAHTLSAWMERVPKPPDSIRGLLVIDDAQSFAPSTEPADCLHSLLQLVGTARAHGLGIVFATQEPAALHPSVIAEARTQLFGRVSSPTATAAVREHLRQRGGDGRDLPRLEAGTFYAYTPEMTAPTRIRAPLCLSYHPSDAPERARRR